MPEMLNLKGGVSPRFLHGHGGNDDFQKRACGFTARSRSLVLEWRRRRREEEMGVRVDSVRDLSRSGSEETGSCMATEATAVCEAVADLGENSVTDAMLAWARDGSWQPTCRRCGDDARHRSGMATMALVTRQCGPRERERRKGRGRQLGWLKEKIGWVASRAERRKEKAV